MLYSIKKIENLDFSLIEELIKEGKSSVEIAKELKVSYPTIYLKTYKIEARRKGFY